jgi:hypothetical protein
VADGAAPVLGSLHGRRRALLWKEGLGKWMEWRTRTVSPAAVLDLIGWKQRQSAGEEPSGGKSEGESERE